MKHIQIKREILVAIFANISSIAFGISIGWSSPNVPKLQDATLSDTPLDRVITANEVGWIGSLVPIGGAISPFIGGLIASRFGRKMAMLTSNVNLICAYIILGFGQSIGLIYAARLMHGFSVGLVMTVVPMYIGEIAQDSQRGPLAIIMMLFMNLGVLLSYCIAPFVAYTTFQYICLTIPAIAVILFFFMPESPTYYLLSGNRDGAIKSLIFLRNKTEKETYAEIDMIQLSIDQTQNLKGSWTHLFTKRGNLRALTISVGLMFVQQFSGVNPVVYYSQTIFIRAGGDFAPEISSIIIGSVPVICCCIAPFAIKRFGRKITLIVSGIGMAIGSGLLGLYFMLDDQNASIVDSLSFLPITALILYFMLCNLGVAPVPWVIVSEIFAPDIKAYGVVITSTLSSIFATIAVQFFEPLNEAVGSHWVFWIFTVCSVMGLGFIQFFVIETKGLSLLEIQDKLNNL